MRCRQLYIRRLFLIFISSLIGLSLGPYPVEMVQAQSSSIAPTVVHADERGLSLVWSLPDYTVDPTTVDDQLYTRIEMAGLKLSAEPGRPEVPVYSGLIGLPADGEAQLRLLEVRQETVNLSQSFLPAPVPEPVQLALVEPDKLPAAGPTTRTPDQVTYYRNRFFPAEVASLGPSEQMRDHRLARLTINPVQVNPVTGQAKILRLVRLEVVFSRPGRVVKQAADTTLDQALQASLLNPAAIAWRSQAGADKLGRAVERANENVTKVVVNQAGLYALSSSDLEAAGWPVSSLDPRTFKLYYGYPRQEVAIWVEGEADGSFDPADRLLFYAAGNFNRYSPVEVYFLHYGGAEGLRMTNRSADPAGLAGGSVWRSSQAEVNRFYDSLYAGRDGDRWFWDNLRQPDDLSGSYTLWLDGPQTNGPNAELTLWLQGYTSVAAVDPDHRVAVSFNGVALGEVSWDGGLAIEQTFSLPGAILQAGANQVELSLPGTGHLVEGTWLDAIEVVYPANQAGMGQLALRGQAGQRAYTLAEVTANPSLLFDISIPMAPQRLFGYSLAGGSLSWGDDDAEIARYLVAGPDQLKTPYTISPAKTFTDPAGGADYIIITHPDFLDAVAPLAAHRAAQGLRTVSVDVETIYDVFGTGRIEPEAIKTFLGHAYHNWAAPAPLYVLLVGDGSYDFRHYSGWNPAMFLPPYLAEVDPWVRETAADNRYVTVSGDDALPDLLIGRLPVNSPAEARTVVNKIISYEVNPVPGGWNARHLFVSDDKEGYDPDFHHSANLAYDQLAPPFIGRRLYLNEQPSQQAYLYTDPAVLRTDFINQVNLGAGVITFHGHASWHQWAAEAIFRWSLTAADNDVDSLANQGRLPVVLQMTCFTSYFHHPEYPTMDESLLRLAGGGAIAIWGSTGLGVATGHEVLQERFYEEILQENPADLGTIFLAGKLAVYASGFNRDLIDTYTLIGDPALHVDTTIVPFSSHLYVPLVFR